MSAAAEGPTGQAPARRGAIATLVVVGITSVIVFGAIVGFGPHDVVAPSGSPGASSTPFVPAGDWTDLGQLDPLQPLATLDPVKADAAGIASDTAFTLASLTSTSAETLAAGLSVEPAIAVRVVPAADRSRALITPAAPLEPGRRYHFRLTSPDGALAGRWIYQVKAPIHVVTAVPGDRSTDVPVTTGIELTFDQEGVIDAASHFRIEPAVEGRFETHGRTLVFVPSKLAPATLYTVTLRAGIGMAGSDAQLEQDVRIRFETDVRAGRGQEPFVVLGRALTEAAPDERAVITVQVESPEVEGEPGSEPVTSLPVEVYRLPDADAALRAARIVVDAPEWARTSAGLVSTAGLARVMSFDGKLEDVGFGAQFIRLPDLLPLGAYLVVIPREARDVQGLLQVTRLASYTLVSATRSLVWTNTIGGGALAGVKVSVVDGPALGTTDASGLLVFDTPPALDTAAGPVLLTLASSGGERVVVPVGTRPRVSAYLGGICCGADDPLAQRWWTALSTDRVLYRQTDTVNLWGYLRDRDTNAVPGRADVRISLADQDFGSVTDAPPIASTSVTPRATGAFAAALQLTDAPMAAYRVDVLVDGRIVASSWFEIGQIRKPAYKLTLALDRHVFITGDSLKATATARFFEGTVAPSVPVSFESPGDDDPLPEQLTDEQGNASVTLPVRLQYDPEGMQWASVDAGVTTGGEGIISANAPVLIFPSRSWVEGVAKLTGNTLSLTGSVHAVDVARLERQFATTAPYDAVDPKGAAIAGASVTSEIVELVPVRRLVGQRYDFITKQTVNLYDYDVKEVSLGTRALTADANGAFSLVRTVPNVAHDYRIDLRVTDDGGRTMTARLYASAPAVPENQEIARPYLGTAPLGCGGDATSTYGVGDAMRLTMRDGYGTYPTGQGNTYLFTTAQRGLREVRLQASPTLERAFTEADLPNLAVQAVRFNGRAYLDGAGVEAAFQTSQRELDVRLSADAASYRPGGLVTVTVRTLDRLGRPAPATVTVRGVDEKIYALGGAQEEDPIGQLYSWVASGLEASYASHAVIWPPTGDGCGGGGGGGDGRDDFRDTLVYRQLDTGADGRATVTFRLSDDLTSWHLSAAAVTGERAAGVGSLLIPVGLPFFVEPTLAPEYLLGDRPSVRLRAFGSSLHAGDAVTFTVASESLGMPATTVSGRAFQPVDVPLPTLRLGDQALVISGSTTGGALSDRLTRHFAVVESRLMRTETRYSTLVAGTTVEGGTGLTTYVFSDAGRGRYLPILQDLAWDAGARLDQALAAAEARKLLIAVYGLDPAQLPDATFDPARYQHGDQGIALFPYASPSLELTVRAVLAAPDVFDQLALRNMVGGSPDSDEGPTREQRIQRLVLGAVIGEDVLGDVREAAMATDLTVRERLYLALAASANGDAQLATDLERAVLAEYGERRGPWVRLRPGGSPNGTPDGGPEGQPTAYKFGAVAAAGDDETVAVTALWAIVAVEVGDPYADEAEAYVEANPMADDLTSLQRLAFAARAIERTPSAPARFAYSVDGARTVVELAAGETRTLTLTAAQRATLRLEPLGGEVALTSSWRVPLDPATVQQDPALTLTRTVTPSGPVQAGQLVTVDLRLTFGGGAPRDCIDVVDLAPSGLAPLAAPPSWLGSDQSRPEIILSPYLIAGQHVAFCAGLDPGRIAVTMRYYARVVTPGTYAWEPASAQSGIVTESITLTRATTIELR